MGTICGQPVVEIAAPRYCPLVAQERGVTAASGAVAATSLVVVVVVLYQGRHIYTRIMGTHDMVMVEKVDQ